MAISGTKTTERVDALNEEYRKYKRLATAGGLGIHLGNLNKIITRVIILKANTNIVLMCVGNRCQSYSVFKWPSTLLLMGGL